MSNKQYDKRSEEVKVERQRDYPNETESTRAPPISRGTLVEI